MLLHGNRLTRDVTASTNDTRDYEYTYDGLHRLQTYDRGTWSGSAITSSQQQREWELDQLGNWDKTYSDLTQTTVEEDRTHNDANELTAFTTPTANVDPVHDAAGNMTEAPNPADPTVKHKYVFDAWNRLVKVTDASDVSIQENEFDGLNRRIVKIDKTGASDVTYDYYYNQQWQVAEIRKDGDADPWKQYVYHPEYVDAIAVRYYDSDTDGTGVVSHYYLQDANYNVTAVTDNTGTVKERYAYTPYGEVTFLDANFANPATSSAISNEYLYTGRRLDPETGLQLNRNRFYHATMGRWMNRDPIGYKGGMNLYGYVDNEPMEYNDPYGEAKCHSALQVGQSSANGTYRFSGKMYGVTGRRFNGIVRWKADDNGVTLYTEIKVLGRVVSRGEGSGDVGCRCKDCECVASNFTFGFDAAYWSEGVLKSDEGRGTVVSGGAFGGVQVGGSLISASGFVGHTHFVRKVDPDTGYFSIPHSVTDGRSFDLTWKCRGSCR